MKQLRQGKFKHSYLDEKQHILPQWCVHQFMKGLSLFTGEWWDIAGLLGAKTGLGLTYGVFGHFSNGILLAVLYAGIVPSIWGPTWLRALIFVTAETVALVWFFMFPLLGAGIAGVEMAAIIPVLSMVRHWAYAIPLWFFVHQLEQ